jgi:chromosome segregation ATPase
MDVMAGAIDMLNATFARLRNARVLVTVGLVGLALASVANGQAQRPNATLDALVLEVQALRAEMNQAASASILVGRLQMEDERIAGAIRELAAVQAELTTGEKRASDLAEDLTRLEDSMLAAQPDARTKFEPLLTTVRETMEQHQRRQATLKRRKDTLARDLRADQTRWADINARLEHFEQALAAR